MKGKILIVEDEFIIASDLQMILERAGYEVAGIASSVVEALQIINTERPAWVFLDIYLIGKLTGIDLANKLMELFIPFIYVSANSNQSILELAKATKPYGFLVKPFREKDILVTLDVAQYRYDHDIEYKLHQETDLQSKVLQLIAEPGDKIKKLVKIIKVLEQYIPFDFFMICWEDKEKFLGGGHAFLKNNKNDFDFIDCPEFMDTIGKPNNEIWIKYTTPDSNSMLFNAMDFNKLCQSNEMDKQISLAYKVESMIAKSIEISQSKLLTFSFYSKNKNIFTEDHNALVTRLHPILNNIANCIPKLSNFILPHIISNNKTSQNLKGNNTILDDRFSDEKLGLIGNSLNFKAIKEKLATVASFNISVLLLGESGTGKEKIARAIHHLSPRASKPMIKVNCAAIPASLMESELFGHEKGSFTGATDLRIGKFEQAIGGTIFLDEIGDLPLDMQVKLLCILQEKEITRLGSNKVIKTDVRVIAATNLNLEKAVAEGKFRLDLYYRLNGFPIMLPPLRERKDDIPILVSYFLEELSKRMGKKPQKISPKVLDELISYPWPGNIRELENLIERSIVLNDGEIINHIEISHNSINIAASPTATSTEFKTIKEMERDYIMSVLQKCNGKVSGAGGAAEIMDIPSNTLIAKIKKLGITKNFK